MWKKKERPPLVEDIQLQLIERGVGLFVIELELIVEARLFE